MKKQLRRFIIKHKGKRCEAVVWCPRSPVGSVVAIPEDKDGNELAQMAIWVCGVHKLAAMDAAREYAQEYEHNHELKEAKTL